MEYHPKDCAAQFLQRHKYTIVDRDVMPFKYGITPVDFIAYDNIACAFVAVKVYSCDEAFENIEAEWSYKDRPYFMRAIKRYVEKHSIYGDIRADLVWVKRNGYIMHMVGHTKTRKEKVR